MSRLLRALTAASILLVAIGSAPVAAAAPSNDLPSAAAAVGALPYTFAQDTTEATVTTDDVGCGAGGVDLATVWYAITPAQDATLEIDTQPSDYLVGINVFAGSADAAHLVDCASDLLRFDATAGVTYYLMFADINDDGVNGGLLDGEVRVAAPPINVSITIDTIGTAHPKTGEARITGTMTCDRPAEYAEVTVDLRQVVGRFYTLGMGGASVDCSPTPTPFETIVGGENGMFRGGRASAKVTAFACEGGSCGDASLDVDLRLRRGTWPMTPEVRLAVEPAFGAIAPANDDFGSATSVPGLPYSDTLDTTGATSTLEDPGYCLAPEIGADPAIVWYRYDAVASGPLLATTFGSDYDTTLYVGTANGAGGIDVLGCSDDTRSHESAFRFDSEAGQTYYFAVGTSPFVGENGGNLVFNLDIGPVAQVVDLDVDAVGSFDRYGTATIRGTVDCTAEATLGAVIVVELMQRVGWREIPSTEFFDFSCPGTDIPFEVRLTSPYGKFLGGHATAQVIAAACSPWECGNETVDLVVRLKR